jgi:hypothetical protein
MIDCNKYLFLEYIKSINFHDLNSILYVRIYIKSQNRMLASDNNSSALLLALVNQEF